MRQFATLCSAATVAIGRLCRNDRGTTMIEYGVVASGIAATVAGLVWAIGSRMKVSFYDKVLALFP